MITGKLSIFYLLHFATDIIVTLSANMYQQ